MSKRAKIIISLGVLVALMPFLGFPGDLESGIVIVLGLVIAGGMYWAEKRVHKCDDCDDHKDKTLEQNKQDELSTPSATFEQEKEEFVKEKSENQDEGSGNDDNSEQAQNDDDKDESKLEQEAVKIEIKEE